MKSKYFRILIIILLSSFFLQLFSNFINVIFWGIIKIDTPNDLIQLSEVIAIKDILAIFVGIVILILFFWKKLQYFHLSVVIILGFLIYKLNPIDNYILFIDTKNQFIINLYFFIIYFFVSILLFVYYRKLDKIDNVGNVQN
jgi:hypothetical protein